MRFKVTFERETEGRRIAEVGALGVLVYGQTCEDAYGRAKAAALFALSGLAETEGQPIEDSIQFEAV
jgi:predicted RNase H-like HicB family nuclease